MRTRAKNPFQREVVSLRHTRNFWANSVNCYASAVACDRTGAGCSFTFGELRDSLSGHQGFPGALESVTICRATIFAGRDQSLVLFKNLLILSMDGI